MYLIFVRYNTTGAENPSSITYLNLEQIMAFLIFVVKKQKFGVQSLKILRQLPSIYMYIGRIFK